jgi:hypothetical protein
MQAGAPRDHMRSRLRDEVSEDHSAHERNIACDLETLARAA